MAAEREAQRPVCSRCGTKFTDERWEETEAPSACWKAAGDRSVSGSCYADDVARQEAAAEAGRQEAAAEAARHQAAVAEPEDDLGGWRPRRTGHGQEPGMLRRGLFRRRT
jgi:hypothetical protein